MRMVKKDKKWLGYESNFADSEFPKENFFPVEANPTPPSEKKKKKPQSLPFWSFFFPRTKDTMKCQRISR